MLPHARHDQLVVQEVMDETLIYDLQTHRAHCLNETAAVVWRSCDGQTSLESIAETLRKRHTGFAAAEAGAAAEVVALAVQQLDAIGLLHPVAAPTAARISRREVARRLGLVGSLAVLVPAITSIAAPTAAMAASPTCIQTGRACTFFDACCNGRLCGSGNPNKC